MILRLCPSFTAFLPKHLLQSVSQSYTARRVDRNGLTHRSMPDTGVMYKSGYFTVAAHMLKNTTSYFRNPCTCLLSEITQAKLRQCCWIAKLRKCPC